MTKSNQELKNEWILKLNQEKNYLKLLQRKSQLHSKFCGKVKNKCKICTKNKEEIKMQQKNIVNITSFINQYC